MHQNSSFDMLHQKGTFDGVLLWVRYKLFSRKMEQLFSRTILGHYFWISWEGQKSVLSFKSSIETFVSNIW